MCGVVAWINLNGRPVDARALATLAGVLHHRGPDEEGAFVDGSVGLYHKRLSIIDLSTGRQPMTNGDVTIVFNGEIYNYVELREELKARGRVFQTTSDTEVLLHLYAVHGPTFVTRLNGMFAFVLYDAKLRRVVTARDHFGIKPLYVWRTPHSVVFASEIKAILQHPEMERAVDQAGLDDYLTFQYILDDHTLFAGVRKLLPGHFQVLDLGSGHIETTKFWEPKFEVDPHHTEEYFVETLRALFQDAIRLQVRSDVPVGCHLSGGTDSSLVAMLASQRVTPLKTFTGAFAEGPEFDEREYSRAVAAACGAEAFEIVPTQSDFIEYLPKLVYHMDEPVAGPGLLPQYVVSKTAAREVKVCLGGQGGDEMFGGYARYLVAYLEQALKGAIFETAEEREHIVSFRSILPNLPSLKQYVPMLTEFWRDGLFEAMDRRYFRLIDRSGGEVELLAEERRQAYLREDVFGRFQKVFNHPQTLSYYNKMTHYDLVTNLPALLHVEDRVSMACSLESRVPLLDHRIADLVTSIPPGMKFKGGELKYILRKAIRGWIPDVVLDRKDKKGFPVPLHVWARSGRTRELFADTLLSSACRNRGIFDVKQIERLLDGEGAYGRKLWGVLNLELWHHLFIDKPARAQ